MPSLMRNRFFISSLALGALVACSGESPSNGRTVSPGDGFRSNDAAAGGGGSACGYVNVNLERMTPTVMLLVDGSSTMADAFGEASRWSAVYQTLMSTEPGAPGVVTRLEQHVEFGLAVYTSSGSSCPDVVKVDPKLNNRDAIHGAYTSYPEPVDWRTIPEDQWRHTPTAESLASVRTLLASTDADGPKVIVLATDGLPDTCADPDAEYGTAAEKRAAQQGVLDATRAAYDQGIQTWVIGVGPEITEDHLQAIANVGVGQQADSADPASYYVALTPEQLVGAFELISGRVSSCVFRLQNPLTSPETAAADGQVELDGRRLSHPDQWKVIDAQTIEVLGQACDDIREGRAAQVEASFPCELIIY